MNLSQSETALLAAIDDTFGRVRWTAGQLLAPRTLPSLSACYLERGLSVVSPTYTGRILNDLQRRGAPLVSPCERSAHTWWYLDEYNIGTPYNAPALGAPQELPPPGEILSGAVDFQTIGSELRAMRERAGLTQAAVSARTGLKRENVARAERGKHIPSIETVNKIARACGVRLLFARA